MELKFDLSLLHFLGNISLMIFSFEYSILCCGLCRTMSKGEVALKTKYLLADTGYPNTYTFSKAITERMLEKKHQHIPLCILRPSGVNAAMCDPFPVISCLLIILLNFL